MTKDALMTRKQQARQEREFHLQQAGLALGIETDCDFWLAELAAVVVEKDVTP